MFYIQEFYFLRNISELRHSQNAFFVVNHSTLAVLRSRSIFDQLRLRFFFSPAPAQAPMKKRAFNKKKFFLETTDVLGPISNDQRATPEPNQDYRYGIASHAEQEAP